MLKSFEVIGVSAVFLLLGLTVPASSHQEKEEMGRSAQQEEPKAQPETRAPQEKQPEPRPQPDARTPQQQQPQPEARTPQEKQPEPKPQPDARAPQQQQPRPQVQAKTPQNQQAKAQRAAASSQRPQRTQQATAAQRAQPALRLSARSSSRIPDARFQSNFGSGHHFQMGNPVMVGGYSRFQYGGYWFGFVQPWPVGWYYTDDVYIDYVDGGYYMFDPYYPGARFAISVVL